MTERHDPDTGEVLEGEELPEEYPHEEIPASTSLVPRPEVNIVEATPIVGMPDIKGQLENYRNNRATLVAFIRDYLVESNYKNDRPVSGQLGDYYKVPYSSTWAPTKTGAEKIASLFNLFRCPPETTRCVETKEFCSVEVRVTLVGLDGRVRGGASASCTTAEKGFQDERSKKKYGGDFRAAMNDIVARAGKRAYVQAVVVTCGLDEVFGTMARGLNPAKEPKTSTPATRDFKTFIDAGQMPLGQSAGSPLRLLSTDYLRQVLASVRNRDVDGQLGRENADLLEAKLEMVLDDRTNGE